jgi:hypothetical protein
LPRLLFAVIAPYISLDHTQMRKGFDASSCSKSFVGVIDITCFDQSFILYFMRGPSAFDVPVGCSCAGGVHYLFQLLVLFDTLKQNMLLAAH